MEYNNGIQSIDWSEAFEVSLSEENIPENYIKCLRESFGHSRFREQQWKIISSILHEAQDNCVILATGYGKSLCYQFPSVFLNTITIVISPLISLMEEQVAALRFYELKACVLGSAQPDKETLEQVINRQYNIVYVTPEYISSQTGLWLIDRVKDCLTLIAIDEAHCISKWGHNFRTSYRKLGALKQHCPNVPFLAMTSTATELVQKDIIINLQMCNPQVITASLDRPNLDFTVKQKTNIWQDIGPYIQNEEGSAIIYCLTRKTTMKVATKLQENGKPCSFYHAGLSLNLRKQIQHDFLHDRSRIIVATVAFGMGINKPDIRLVINYGMCKDIESYYQEVGRAGRDGLAAKCVMFYHRNDRITHMRIVGKNPLNYGDEEMITLSQDMNRYVYTTHCRRKFILSYLGENCDNLKVRPNCCDNCRRATSKISLFNKYHGICEDGLIDITDEAHKLLTVVSDMPVECGIDKAFLVLKGSQSKLVPKSFLNHRLYGSLRDKPLKWLNAVRNSLITNGMLKISIAGRFSGFLQSRCLITETGTSWLNGVEKQNPIKVEPNDEYIELLKPKILRAPEVSKILPSTSNAAIFRLPVSSGTDLYRMLIDMRFKLASLHDIMPYLVASTKALQQLIVAQPTSMEELRSIKLDGYSDEKINHFGNFFLKVIKDYRANIESAKEKNKPPIAQCSSSKISDFWEIKSGKQQTAEDNQSSNMEEQVTQGTSQNRANKEEKQFNMKVQNISSNPIEVLDESSRESIEIIEQDPEPIIEITSDNEQPDTNTEFDASNYLDIQMEGFNQPDCENEELALLVDAIKADKLSQLDENGTIHDLTHEEENQSNTKEENVASNTIELHDDSSQESVEIIEQDQQPIIEINSDNEEPITDQVLDVIETEIFSQSDCENEELTLLIEAIKSDKLSQPKENVRRADVDIKKENTADCDTDLFDGYSHSTIDEVEITQISKNLEHQSKYSSPIKSSPSKVAGQSVELRSNCQNHEFDNFMNVLKIKVNQMRSADPQKKIGVTLEFAGDSSTEMKGSIGFGATQDQFKSRTNDQPTSSKTFDVHEEPSENSVEMIETNPHGVIKIESERESCNSDADAGKAILGANTNYSTRLSAVEQLQPEHNSQLKHNPTHVSVKLENNANCVEDLFDEYDDLGIDEIEVSQVCEKIEEELKNESPTKTSSFTPKTDNENAKLNGLFNAMQSNSTQNEGDKRVNKVQRYRKKSFAGFEYEDDSSSESECDKKTVISPRKRALPVWVLESKKKKR